MKVQSGTRNSDSQINLPHDVRWQYDHSDQKDINWHSQMSHLVRRHLSPELCQLLKRVRIEKMSGADLHMETAEGGLKELVMRWFIETQAPQILSDGNFPDWFQGFTARKWVTVNFNITEDSDAMMECNKYT